MYPRKRASARAAALALAPALGCALFAAPLLAQSGKRASHSAHPSRTAHSAPASVGDTSGVVVATVNGEKITRAEVVSDLLRDQQAKLATTDPRFEDRQRTTAASIGALVMKRMSANGGKPVTVTKAEITDWFFKDKPATLYQTVQGLIAERAIMQAARKEGVTATPAEVNAQVTKLIEPARKQLNLSGPDAHLLAVMGYSADYLRPMAKTQVVMQKLARKDLERKIGHPYGNGDYVSASQVLVLVQPNPTDPADTEKKFEEARKKIEGIAADIKSGKTTFEAATKENQDASRLNNGSVGVIVRDMPNFDTNFMKAAFGLSKGKVSEPVRSQFGWHLIRVDRTGDELTAPEKQQALDRALQQEAQLKASDIMKSAKILNSVTPPAQPGGMQVGNR